jgi:hypothetical protein
MNLPVDCHSRESGNPWPDLLENWFAQRHEGTKRFLRVFVSLCETLYRHPRVGGGPTPDRFSNTPAQVLDSRLRGNDEISEWNNDVRFGVVSL